MGRQAAGNGFLRAAVAGRQGQPVWAYTPHRTSAENFGRLVRDIDPSAEVRWVPADRLDLLSQIGTLYWPAPGIEGPARLRLRAKPDAYSLCGVTHTTASHSAMDAIVSVLNEPVMPWDALICTSHAVASTVTILIQSQLDYLRWRYGSPFKHTLPQLPVIPLGVHSNDFCFTAEYRAAARRSFRLSDDEVVLLFVGRLSFHAKAHPHPMYLGAQSAFERTGKKIVLLQCGWFGNPEIESAFKQGAKDICPDVRTIFVDGRDAEVRRQSWAAADVFVSLSDNIQETFGLTPIEAMAAGLPAVVTDWNGYKDTLRHGVDGFRVPTWMPPPSTGERFARSYEAGVQNYDLYVGTTCQTISLDLPAFVGYLCDLISTPELRSKLGESGRRRAREVFDWAVVYAQYQALWLELASIRQTAHRNPEYHPLLRQPPRAAAGRMDPFNTFQSYPTALIQAGTIIFRSPGATSETYRILMASPLFAYGTLPSAKVVQEMLDRLDPQGQPLASLAEQLRMDLKTMTLAVSLLAKMGLLQLRACTQVQTHG